MQPHPVLLVLMELLLTSIIVGFTAPSSSIRLGILPIIALCTWQCISTAMEFMVRCPWAALVGGYSVTYLFHYVDVALLSRWSFEADGPTSGLARSAEDKDSTVRHRQGSSWEKFVFGLSITCTSRFIRTPYQVKNVPHFSNNDPSYVPSRPIFLCKTAVTIILCYMTVDMITSPTADPELNMKYFSTRQIALFTRLHEISGEEIGMRVAASIAAAITMTSVQGGVYSIVAFLGVLLGLSEPQDWPPFYGPLSEGYSLRRFWSRFWHQTNSHKFSAISNFVVHDVFRLTRGNTVARYARVVTIFAISALMHVLIDIATGMPLGNSGALTFFCTQVLGIIIEDMVKSAYCFVESRDKDRPASVAEKLVGYTWVGAFLIWSTPVYLYPMMYRTNAGLNDSVIPFSLVKLLS